MKLAQLLGLNPGQDPVAANPILKMLGIGGPGPMGSIDPSTFQGSPGYQYAKQQALGAATSQNSIGPGGGNALLALQKTGQGLADQNWGNYLSEASTAWQQLLGNIGGGVGVGQNAVSQLSGAGQNFANAAGNNLTAIGNAQGAGAIGGANALTGGINSGLGNLNSYINSRALLTALQGGGGYQDSGNFSDPYARAG